MAGVSPVPVQMRQPSHGAHVAGVSPTNTDADVAGVTQPVLMQKWKSRYAYMASERDVARTSSVPAQMSHG